jgi:hypothetical protein
MTGLASLIEYSDMENFTIGELRIIGTIWHDAKEHEIRMSLERERSFMESTLGVILKNAEEEYRRQVILFCLTIL